MILGNIMKRLLQNQVIVALTLRWSTSF